MDKNKMTIIIVNDFAYVNGGTGKIALGSAIELAARGNRVILFSSVGPVAPELLGLDGLEVICLGQKEILRDPNRMRAVTQGFWNRLAQSRMRQLLSSLSREKTVIHVHSWTKALSTSFIPVAVDLGFKVVMTLHDFFTACPAGTFFNYAEHEICHLTPMSLSCVRCNCDARSYGHKLWRVGRQGVQLRFGMVPATIKHYISISDLSEDILAPTLPANARIRRVRNFIDTLPWSKPVPVDRNDTFVYAGRLSSEKGALLFARAAEQTRVKTVFVGDGPLRHQVERLAPNAEFTGWLNPSDTLSRLRDARALVFPSLWYETQGLVVGEAASMGVPAIVPDTCAAREWVEDGVTGLWFRGGDQTSLIKQLRLLNDQPELAAALGKEAHRRYWEQPATRARHCEELMSLYQQILAAQLNEPIPVCETS